MTARVIPFARPGLPVPAPSREAMLEDIALAHRVDPDMPAARAAYVAGFIAGYLKAALPETRKR